ncbi:hypothetical protein CKAH01_09720 [Colletotrichum kahawae]|uniref:Uncharacterized protein n=1 Tax=Colletotrichum kahawae TaxID=34407 RepID=A0AAD9Y101_COLKA|nr:hypothetical protein CKAH01_09720 [Colletotrichum kahawae]
MKGPGHPSHSARGRRMHSTSTQPSRPTWCPPPADICT